MLFCSLFIHSPEWWLFGFTHFFWLVHMVCCEHSVHVSWSCALRLSVGLIPVNGMVRLKKLLLFLYKWNHYDEVELHKTAKLCPEWLCRIFLPISTESFCWSITGVLNFGKSSGYKMMYFYGVHLSSCLYLYWLLAFLQWNVVQAFQSFFVSCWVICFILLIYWSSLYILRLNSLLAICIASSLSLWLIFTFFKIF